MQTINLDLLEFEPDDIVLDLGCGAGRHSHAASLKGVSHVVALDISIDDLRKTRDGFSFFTRISACSPVAGDALMLPFPDGCFDHIICSEVLEHIPDHEAALAEMTRVLKPGGTLALSVPRFVPEWLCWKLSADYHNAPGGHLRIFRESALRGAVEARAFSFRNRHFAHGLHTPYWWLKCAVGVNREDVRLVNLYRRFLEWDILKRPLLTRLLERITAPLMGKSLVLYFIRKDAP